MKLLLSAAAIAVTSLVIGASSAAAFSTWSNFESNGFHVKARYDNGQLRHINAVNDETGEEFKGFVTSSGIAVVQSAGTVQRIDLNALQNRLENRTTLQDLALLK